MKLKPTIFILLFYLAFFAQLHSQELDSLFNKINNKIKTYNRENSYSCYVITKEFSMDKHWQVEKIKVTEKTVTQKEDERNENIIKATEIKKDEEKDITEEVRKEQSERLKELEEQRSVRSDNEETSSLNLSLESFFPFSDSTKDQYTFTLMADTVIDNQSYIRIQADAKEKARDRIEGIYWIETDTYTITYMDLHFSQNPRFIKDLRMKFWFNEFDDNHWLPVTIWTHVHVGLVIKNIRMEVEEKYSDYVFE